MIGPRNVRSRRAVEKIGGVLVGPQVDGNGRERVLYRIEAPAFAAGPLGTTKPTGESSGR